jgi:hypothetical protein
MTPFDIIINFILGTVWPFIQANPLLVGGGAAGFIALVTFLAWKLRSTPQTASTQPTDVETLMALRAEVEAKLKELESKK